MLAPAVLFGLGVFLDFFWGGQVGMWALSLLLIYGAMLLASKYLAGQATIVLFALYVASTGLAFAVAYFVTRGSLGNAPNLLAVMGQMIPTLLLFPLADWLIERFDDADVRFR
jgi:rod shape-determining protein MreD